MKVWALAVTAMALAPIAEAQTTCAQLNSLIASAPSHFKDRQGEKQGENFYNAKGWLADADECGVDLNDGDVFYCYWFFDTPNGATKALDGFLDIAKPCLPDWMQVDLANTARANGIVATKGLRFLAGSGREEGTRVNILIERQSALHTVVLEVVRK